MGINRRRLIGSLSGAPLLFDAELRAAESSAPIPATVPAASSSMAALTAVNLDPLVTYRRMFASLDARQGCYWCFAGPLSFDLPDVGAIPYVQEETFRAQRTHDDGPDGFLLEWREAGVFRDLQTGEATSSYRHPATGEVRALGRLRHDAARFVIRRSPEGLDIRLESRAGVVHGITIAATVDGDRVSLTHTEYKSSAVAGSRWQSATLKIYSSLVDLRGDAPSVPARGVYNVRVATTGTVFVGGVMQKAAPDERINPAAWDRVRALYPDFFDDAGRVDLRWIEG